MNLTPEIKEKVNKALSVEPQEVANEIIRWLITNVESYIDNHSQHFDISIIFTEEDEESDNSMPYSRAFAKTFEEFDTSMAESQLSEFESERAALQERRAEIVGEEGEDGEALQIPENLTSELAKIDSSLAELKETEENPWKLASEDDEGTEYSSKLFDYVDSVHEAIQNSEELLKELFGRMSFFYELKGFRDSKPIHSELEGYARVEYFAYEAMEVPVQVTRKTPELDEQGNLVAMKEEVIKEITLPPGFALELELEFWAKPQPTSLF
jgi:hypothetical protein